MDKQLQKNSFFAITAIVLSLIWLGMILGISVLETPVKFTAPTATVPIALDIGRTVFRAFSIVQLVLLALLLFSLFLAKSPRLIWGIIAVVAVCLILQFVWLLPILSARVGLVQAGQPLPKTQVHNIYTVFELLKIFGLLWIGIGGIKHLQNP